jgi:hypothetical protein
MEKIQTDHFDMKSSSFVMNMEEVKTIMSSLPKDENIEVFTQPYQVTGSSYDEQSDKHWRASASMYYHY